MHKTYVVQGRQNVSRWYVTCVGVLICSFLFAPLFAGAGSWNEKRVYLCWLIGDCERLQEGREVFFASSSRGCSTCSRWDCWYSTMADREQVTIVRHYNAVTVGRKCPRSIQYETVIRSSIYICIYTIVYLDRWRMKTGISWSMRR